MKSSSRLLEQHLQKEMWGILLIAYKGADRIKQIKLRTLQGKFEMLKMTSTEGDSDYITQVQIVMNQLKKNGESLSEQNVIEKILISLIDIFENVVCIIEESKDLVELIVDELIGSLLAHEKRKKVNKKILNETLQAKVILEEKTLYV
jgi:gag-polypeptide of LTR copia-type